MLRVLVKTSGGEHYVYDPKDTGVAEAFAAAKLLHSSDDDHWEEISVIVWREAPNANPRKC